MHSSNFLLTSKKILRYYYPHYHCIICAPLARIEVQEKQAFLLFAVI
jgi:hypothetical protein